MDQHEFTRRHPPRKAPNWLADTPSLENELANLIDEVFKKPAIKIEEAHAGPAGLAVPVARTNRRWPSLLRFKLWFISHFLCSLSHAVLRRHGPASKSVCVAIKILAASTM